MRVLNDEEAKAGFIEILIRQHRRFRREERDVDKSLLALTEDKVAEKLYGHIRGGSHG